ncbi:hypothetical protein D1872_330330 [compost metagenome]
MAETVVEQFEAIQIDVQQRQTASSLTRTLMRFMQALAEQRAVGQPGELVVMGQIAHALFGFAAC